MCISSSVLLVGAVNAMIEQQSALARTQNQVATGNRVNNASDDPIAAVRILDLTRTQAESDQYGKNSDIARGRLSEEEQALADSTSMLQGVRDLVVQAANTATLSDSDMPTGRASGGTQEMRAKEKEKGERERQTDSRRERRWR